MTFWPAVTPGTTSTSISVSVAFCASAKRFTLAWLKRISALIFSGTSAMAASISACDIRMLPSYLSSLAA